MTDLTIVEWGDGSGFALVDRPDRPRPPKPFAAAAEHLIRYPAVQPRESTGDPARCPVWCLLEVDVEDAGPHWCFTVQGHGGAFGRAGSCQFLFAHATFDPQDVWIRGIEMIGPDGRLQYGKQRELPFALPEPDRLFGPLVGLTAGRECVALAGDPLAVAADITALLGVLPIPVIRSRIWATFLLKRPVLAEKAVASGHPPPELGGSDTARRVREWLGEVPVPPDRGSRESDALHLVASQAAAGGVPDYRALPDMKSLVDKALHDGIGIRAEDVPRLLAENPHTLRTPKALQVVAEWATTEPERAITHLVPSRFPSDLQEALLDGVFQAHYHATQGSNPARFPPASEKPFHGWHEVLALAVLRRMPELADRIEFVRDTLIAPGRPLADAGRAHRAVPWLRRIGVSPDDPTITIFPPSVEAIVAALSGPQEVLSAHHREFLLSSPDSAGILGQVVGKLHYITVPVADQLLDVLSKQLEARPWLLGEILRHNWQFPKALSPTHIWVEELAERRRNDAVVIVEGAYGFLVDIGELTGDQLSQALMVYADIPPTTDTRRKLLLEAANRVRMPLEQPAPTPSPRQFGPTGTYGGSASYGDSVQADPRYEVRRATEANPSGTGYRPVPAEPTAGDGRYDRRGHREELSPGLQLAIYVGVLLVAAFALVELLINRM